MLIEVSYRFREFPEIEGQQGSENAIDDVTW
jgi:hypothetical protein